jgi:hypothetical protein
MEFCPKVFTLGKIEVTARVRGTACEHWTVTKLSSHPWAARPWFEATQFRVVKIGAEGGILGTFRFYVAARLFLGVSTGFFFQGDGGPLYVDYV